MMMLLSALLPVGGAFAAEKQASSVIPSSPMAAVGAVDQATSVLATSGAEAVARSAEQITLLSQQLSGAIYSIINVVVGAFLSLPSILMSFIAMMGNGELRARIGIGFLVMVWVFGAALLVFHGMRPLILRQVRAFCRHRKFPAPFSRVALFSVDGFALVLFLVLVLGLLIVLPEDLVARDAGLSIVGAITSFEALLAGGRALLVADDSRLYKPLIGRLRVKPETGYYLFIWLRRFAATLIYGALVIDVMARLAFDAESQIAMIDLLGLLLAGLAATFIMQNRDLMSGFIRHVSGGYERFARVWHILVLALIGIGYTLFILGMEVGNFRAMTALLMTVAVAILAFLLIGAAKIGVSRLFRISPEVTAKFPGLEKRAAEHERTFFQTIVACVWGVGILALMKVWEIDLFSMTGGGGMRRILDRLTAMGLVLAMGWFAWSIIGAFIDYMMGSGRDGRAASSQARAFRPVVRKIGAGIVLLVTSMIALAQLGVDTTPILAGLGLLGLAIGLGSQSLVKDMMTGVFMLADNVIAIGDYVAISGMEGTVEAIGLRNLHLRGFDGTLHAIPFSDIRILSNQTKDYSCAVLDISVAYRENVDAVMEELRSLASAMRADEAFRNNITEDAEMLGVQSLAENGVVLRLRMRTLSGQQWAVAREFRRRVKNRFDALGIEIPYPHLKIYTGSGDSASTTSRATS